MADYPTHSEVTAKIAAAAGGGGGGGATNVWMHPREFFGVAGSPYLAGGDGGNQRRSSIIVPESAISGLAWTKYLPAEWSSFAADVWWMQNTAAGTVRWQTAIAMDGPGSTITAAPSSPTLTTATPTGANTLTVSPLVTSTTVTARLATLVLTRLPADAADTSTADLIVFGVNLRKLS